MKLFFDTSFLVKLCHREIDTLKLEQSLSAIKITNIYLSEISKVEFTSAIWKQVRTKVLTAAQAQITLNLFELDFSKYNFIAIDSFIIEQARLLISKYGIQGLRSLDSIQLATAVSLFSQVNICLTADRLLETIFVSEGLQTTFAATT